MYLRTGMGVRACKRANLLLVKKKKADVLTNWYGRIIKRELL